jgi:hypothetical protein
MIQSFGGRVTGSVSGRTDVLVVGQAPGFSKTSKARAQPRCTLINLHELVNLTEGSLLADAAPAVIGAFSSGYVKWNGSSNGLAASASAERLMFARGELPPQQMSAMQLPAKKKKKQSRKRKAPPAASNDNDGDGSGGGERPARRTKRASKAQKEQHRAVALSEFNWRAALAAGTLYGETNDFLKALLRLEHQSVSGNKAQLLTRLRECSGLAPPASSHAF